MTNLNTPDLSADNRTVPYGVGYDMERDISKGQWIALVVDMMRSTLGEDAPVGVFRAEIAERLDAMHAAGNIPRTLPKRYPRPASL